VVVQQQHRRVRPGSGRQHHQRLGHGAGREGRAETETWHTVYYAPAGFLDGTFAVEVRSNGSAQ
jgi:hypothetical protein